MAYNYIQVRNLGVMQLKVFSFQTYSSHSSMISLLPKNLLTHKSYLKDLKEVLALILMQYFVDMNNRSFK